MVIAIIALLVSILMPSLAKAREIAKSSVCLMNLRNISPNIKMYMADNNEVMTGWSYWGWNNNSLAPNQAHQVNQTTWYLELHKFSGGKQFATIQDVRDNRSNRNWTRSMSMLVCPVSTWSHTAMTGSYGTNYSTYIYKRTGAPRAAYWLNEMELDSDKNGGIDNGGFHYPKTTTYFNFSRLSNASGTVMLSEMLPHGGIEVMDSTGQTANTINPSYYPGSATARWAHPGGSKLWADNDYLSWEGTNSYLFFDGHVALRQVPPYQFTTSATAINDYPSANMVLPTYAEYVGNQ
ncbi:MAG: hypothetical protein FWE88_07575 [Phycisphaerae bacterium]|nr:hypothetical protein [Phycisphaerae bacterium]